MAAGTILLVEDDSDIADMVRFHVERSGYTVVHDATGSAAVDIVDSMDPDAVLLDLGLPHLDGVDICARIRARSQVPIVMVTARNRESDVIRGLHAGADDYVTKPFSPRELVARIDALLRRANFPMVDTERIRVDSHIIDAGRRSVVTPDGIAVRPTAREFDLVWYLAENAGLVLSRTQILAEVWGYGYEGESRTVDVHVRQLRKKLPQLTIETVWGIGYRMVSE